MFSGRSNPCNLSWIRQRLCYVVYMTLEEMPDERHEWLELNERCQILSSRQQRKLNGFAPRPSVRGA